MAAPVIKIQPGADGVLQNQEQQEYFAKFKPEEVNAWSVNDVVDNVLKPLGLTKYSMQFIDHKIAGRVITALTDHDLMELQMESLGDRKTFLGATAILAKGRKTEDLDAVLWAGHYPPRRDEPNCPMAYYEGCSHFCLYTFCWCFMPTRYFKFSKTGFALEKLPAPCVACCQERSVDFRDFRFLKDLHREYEPCCLCFCRIRSLKMKFAIPEDESTTQWITIQHPRITKNLESQIRQEWGETRLVAYRL